VSRQQTNKTNKQTNKQKKHIFSYVSMSWHLALFIYLLIDWFNFTSCILFWMDENHCKRIFNWLLRKLFENEIENEDGDDDNNNNNNNNNDVRRGLDILTDWLMITSYWWRKPTKKKSKTHFLAKNRERSRSRIFLFLVTMIIHSSDSEQGTLVKKKTSFVRAFIIVWNKVSLISQNRI
jgi:hypothetical protein